MLLTFLKKVFRIELIFIYLALTIFFCTVYFKSVCNEQIQKLDTNMLLLQMNQQNLSLEQKNQIALELQTSYEGYTYFDQELKTELDALTSDIKKGIQNPQVILDFQNHIHQEHTRLNFGFDSLLYSSLFLIAIAAFIILEKFFKKSMQLKELKTIQSEQNAFSLELHDGVAQNLAALKIYLEKEDIPKSKFYANQSLNEIRYMIGSGNINFSDDFEKMVNEIAQTFETNFGIKTNVYTASKKIENLNKKAKTHLIRILQESLSNISRHSNATQVEIKIIDGIDDFSFIICDNGKGFDVKEVEQKKKTDSVKHFGLGNIKKRVNLIGGTVDFINKGGLTIAIKIKDSVYR